MTISLKSSRFNLNISFFRYPDDGFPKNLYKTMIFVQLYKENKVSWEGASRRDDIARTEWSQITMRNKGVGGQSADSFPPLSLSQWLN